MTPGPEPRTVVSINRGKGACHSPRYRVFRGWSNGDGVRNVLDLIELLLAFGAACP